MTRLGRKLVLATALLIPATPSLAGPYADDLGKCLVSSTTDADKQALVRWIFSAITLHPGLSGMSSVTPEQRDRIDASAAALFQRLLTTDCPVQAAAAMQYEGGTAFGSSFELLGKVASTGLFGDPAVSAGIQNMIGKVDMTRVQDALKKAKP